MVFMLLAMTVCNGKKCKATIHDVFKDSKRSKFGNYYYFFVIKASDVKKILGRYENKDFEYIYNERSKKKIKVRFNRNRNGWAIGRTQPFGQSRFKKGDVVDFCKHVRKPTKKPTKKPATGRRGHLIHYGNGKNSRRPQPECTKDSSTRSIYANKKIAVSCCKYASSSRGGSRPGCKQGLTYSQAARYCASKGLRLCTMGQIKAGAAKGSGCGFDAYQVWTRSTCRGLGKKPRAMSVGGLIDDDDVIMSEPFEANEGFNEFALYTFGSMPFVVCLFINACCAYKHCRNEKRIYE